MQQNFLGSNPWEKTNKQTNNKPGFLFLQVLPMGGLVGVLPAKNQIKAGNLQVIT